MQKYRLGKTDLWVSPIGLGTVKFGRNKGVKYPTQFDLPDDNTINCLLNLAKESGINLLDTAPAYGSSEERLGKLLIGTRKEWVIVTKVGEEFAAGKSYFDFSAKHLHMSIERSLSRLQTDYLDIVLVHSDGNDKQIIQEYDVFQTLSRLKEMGKILSFGMSTKTIAGGLLTIDYADAVMATYYPGYPDELPILHYAKERKKGVLIKKALANGHKPNVTESLRFIFQTEAVSSVILGTINLDHLKENIASMKLIESELACYS